MTTYIKIIDDTGAVVAVEALTPPVYVYKQPSNGEIVRCIETLAQGVLDAEGANIYQLYGKAPVDRAVATAMVITTMEYDELRLSLEATDEEDTDPEVPEGTDATQIMTRAELTEKVNELDEAMELLLSGVTE